jgi:hypothetical protein
MSADMIIGLKSNVKRGFGLAEFWETSYKKTIPMLLESWKTICEVSGDDKPTTVMAMAWEVVHHYTHYQKVDSKDIGVFSTIGVMTIPAQTYKTKKGIEKTTPEQKIPAHYTRDGAYLGRVSALGEEPISYKMYLEITGNNFSFVRVGNTIEECFQLIKDRPMSDEVKSKDISKAERKSLTRPKKVVYYILSNYNLTQVESEPSLEEYEQESHLEVDGRTEITYKKIGSDEGGNPEDSDDE